MTKKKSNGFMFFADSRRNIYETEAGTALGARRLVERAAADWARMRPEEQARWKNESRRRYEQMTPSMIRLANSSNNRMKSRGLSQLEKELLGRSRERGVSREEARQTLAHKLIWRETESLETIRLKKWCLLIASERMVGSAPAELWALSFEGDTLISEMCLIVNGEGKQIDSGAEVSVVYWSPSVIADINVICLALAKFIQSCWGSVILVPSAHFSRIADFFHWLKDARDTYCRRDTTSIRLDRLICLEDVIHVFRELNNHPLDDEDDLQWEMLCDEQPLDTRAFGRVACDYVQCCLRRAVQHNQMSNQREEDVVMGGNINPFESHSGHSHHTHETPDPFELVMHWLECCPEDAEIVSMGIEEMIDMSQEYAEERYGFCDQFAALNLHTHNMLDAQ